MEFKVGPTAATESAKRLAGELIEQLITTMRQKVLPGVALYETAFSFGKEGVALEVVLPGKGQIVFRSVTPESAWEIIQKYCGNIKEVEAVIAAEGNKQCHCHH